MSAFVFVVIGLVGLIIGGELLVRGAVSAAKSFGISPMVIGLTIVGFGTSSPELVTSVQAAVSGSSGIAIGNVVGSNIGNVLLILGIAALLVPITVDPAAFKRDGTMMFVATGLCLGTVLIGDIGRMMGVFFLLVLVGYLTFTLMQEMRTPITPAVAVYEAKVESVTGADYGLGKSLGMTIAGLVITIFGARYLVSGAVTLAQSMGVSETVIGLTIVAIGTSMPELVTSLIAVRKGQGDLALGNVLGSNIFNILGVMGITAIIPPMKVPAVIVVLDVWIMCAAAILLIVFARTGWRIGRREGGAMLTCYLGYLLWLLV